MSPSVPNPRTVDVRPRSPSGTLLAESGGLLTEQVHNRGFLLTIRGQANSGELQLSANGRAVPAAEWLAEQTGHLCDDEPLFCVDRTSMSADAPLVRARWIGPTSEEVAIDGEMFRLSFCYIGASADDPTNPSLIDPALELGSPGPDHDQPRPQLVAYARLSAGERRRYVEWQRSGRRTADVPRGFLLLFLSSLEHAIVRDGRREFLGQARTELYCLMEIHQTDSVFCAKAKQLIAACEFLDANYRPAPIQPQYEPNFREEMPFAVRHYLGWMLKTYDRLEADGALLFYLQQPETRIDAAVAQYFREFQAMWCLQFPYAAAAEFSRSPELPHLRLEYQPLTGDFGCIWESDLPDVAALGVSAKLRELYDECVRSIAHLRHQPVGGMISEALVPGKASMLPRERFEPKPGAEARLGVIVLGTEPQPIEVADLLSVLVDADHVQSNKLLSTKRSQLVTRLLDDHGFGFEPDLRFGLPNCLRPDQRVVLFRTEKLPHQGPSEAYLRAQAAVVVSAWAETWLPGLEPLRLEGLEERLPYIHRFKDREYRRLEATRLAVASQQKPAKFIERWLQALFRDKREGDLMGGFGIAFRGQRRNPELAKLARAISIRCPTPIEIEDLLEAAAAVSPSADAFHVGLADRVQILQQSAAPAELERSEDDASFVEAPPPALVMDGLEAPDSEILLALYDRTRSRMEFSELTRNRRVSVAGVLERLNEWGLLRLRALAVSEGEEIALTLEARMFLDSFLGDA